MLNLHKHYCILAWKEKLSNCLLSGKIEAIGNDLDFAPGFCGKNGQAVSNEVGQPTILISEITIGGTKI